MEEEVTVIPQEGQGNSNVAVPIDEPVNKTWDDREENILKVGQKRPLVINLCMIGLINGIGV